MHVLPADPRRPPPQGFGCLALCLVAGVALGLEVMAENRGFAFGALLFCAAVGGVVGVTAEVVRRLAHRVDWDTLPPPTVPPADCPQCGEPQPESAGTCPMCGHDFTS